MGKEVSDKLVIILLIITIVVSVVGTYVVYENLNEKDMDSIYKSSTPTGLITLVVDNNEEDDSIEDFK